MPKFIESKIEIDIKRLSKENYSYRRIRDNLKEENVDVAISSICRVLKNMGIRRKALNKGEEKPKKRAKRLKRTPQMVNKIKGYVCQRNPMCHRDIKKKTSLSLRSINRIIHEDLNLKSRKKVKVHRLSENHKKNRKTTCRKLYEQHLAGERSEYAVTLDEALIYLDDSNGESKICYVKRGEQVPDSWVLEGDKSFRKGFMVVGIITGKGTLPLIRVPSATKINSQYYVDYVLRPLFTEHLPRLYGKDIKKVFFHHDKATSHTADLTTAFLKEMKSKLGITYLAKEDIPVKCPDGSPLDFFGFGYLKQLISRRRPRNLDGVWKVSQEVWSSIDLATIERTFADWKRRLRKISAVNGEHIEQIKSIHSKLFK